MKLSSGWIWKVLLNVAIRCNQSGLIRVKPRKRALWGECSRWSISEVMVFEVSWVLGAGLKNNFKVLRHKWDPDEAWRCRHISLASTHPTLRACDDNKGNTWPLACWEVNVSAWNCRILLVESLVQVRDLACSILWIQYSSSNKWGFSLCLEICGLL